MVLNCGGRAWGTRSSRWSPASETAARKVIYLSIASSIFLSIYISIYLSIYLKYVDPFEQGMIQLATRLYLCNINIFHSYWNNWNNWCWFGKSRFYYYKAIFSQFYVILLKFLHDQRQPRRFFFPLPTLFCLWFMMCALSWQIMQHFSLSDQQIIHSQASCFPFFKSVNKDYQICLNTEKLGSHTINAAEQSINITPNKQNIFIQNVCH